MMMRNSDVEKNIIEERKIWVSKVLEIFNCSNDTATFRAISHIKDNLKDKSLEEIQKQRKCIINTLIGIE